MLKNALILKRLLPLFLIAAFPPKGSAASIKEMITRVQKGPAIYRTPEAHQHFLRKQSEFGAPPIIQVSTADGKQMLKTVSTLGSLGSKAWNAAGVLCEKFPQTIHVITRYEQFQPGQGTFEDWLATEKISIKNQFILSGTFLPYEDMSECRDFVDVSAEPIRTSGSNVTVHYTITYHVAACALKKITGQDFGDDAAQWRLWWAENKNNSPSPAAPPPTSAEQPVPTNSPAIGTIGESIEKILVGGTYRILLKTGDEFTGRIESKNGGSIIIETTNGDAYTFGANLIRNYEVLSLPKKKDTGSAPVSAQGPETLTFSQLLNRNALGIRIKVTLTSGPVFEGLLKGITNEQLHLDRDGSIIPIASNVIGSITTVVPESSKKAAVQAPKKQEHIEGPFDTVIVANTETDEWGNKLEDLTFVGKIEEGKNSVTIIMESGEKRTILRKDIKMIKKHSVDTFQDKIQRYAKKLFCPEGMVLVDVPPGKEGRPFFKVCIDMYEYPNKQGEYPQGNMSYAEAAEICGSQGKRLCTTEEWQYSCSGLEGYTYPYGWNLNKKSCNSKGIGKYEPLGNNRNCVSKFGVYDMVGNIFEWVTTPDGKPAVMGGPYSKCNSVSVSDGSKQPHFGLRCCKSN